MRSLSLWLSSLGTPLSRASLSRLDVGSCSSHTTLASLSHCSRYTALTPLRHYSHTALTPHRHYSHTALTPHRHYSHCSHIAPTLLSHCSHAALARQDNRPCIQSSHQGHKGTHPSMPAVRPSYLHPNTVSEGLLSHLRTSQHTFGRAEHNRHPSNHTVFLLSNDLPPTERLNDQLTRVSQPTCPTVYSTSTKIGALYVMSLIRH